jgi:formate/nitrite transporter
MEYKTKKGNGRLTVTPGDKPTRSELDLIDELVKVRQQAIERTAQLETVVDKLGKAVTPDAHPPATVAQKAEAVGVTKGELNTLSTILLGILAGVFIGLGAMFCTVVTTGIDLGFGLKKLLGGVVFCLGLILVVVAGAELFTGNTLIVMSWISGRTRFTRLLRNWGLVYAANLVGALSLAGLIYYTYQWAFSDFGVGANALLIANGKVNLDFGTALVRGILCNALVCLAVWLCFGARTVVDKILAIIFPITAFVAGGFEHSIANMYFIPMGIFLKGQPQVLAAAGVTAESISNLTWLGFLGNLVPVTIGNIIGGGVLIGVVYWLAYLRRERTVEAAAARPWLRKVTPGFINAAFQRTTPAALAEPVRAQLEELIRTRMEAPIALDTGGKALLSVLARASDDSQFLARLAENPEQALAEYDLTSEEKAAILSGDIRWIESKLGTLNEPLRTWLSARLTQEKW